MSELDELREQCMQQAVTIEQMRLVMRDARYLIADFDLAFARHTVQRMDALIAGARPIPVNAPETRADAGP